MAISCGQVSVSGTVPVVQLPASAYNLVLYSLSATTAYVGTSSGVSAADGMALSTVPMSLATFLSSAPAQLWATTGNTTSTVSVNWLLSTDF